MISGHVNYQQCQDLQYWLEKTSFMLFSAYLGIPISKPCQMPEVTLCVGTMWEGSRDDLIFFLLCCT